MPTPYFCHASSHETYLVEGGHFAHSSMATVDAGEPASGRGLGGTLKGIFAERESYRKFLNDVQTVWEWLAKKFKVVAACPTAHGWGTRYLFSYFCFGLIRASSVLRR